MELEQMEFTCRYPSGRLAERKPPDKTNPNYKRCQACQWIQIRLIGHGISEPSFDLHETFSELEKSAIAGCVSCRIFYRAVLLDQASVASIENLQNSKDPIYVHGETGGKSFPHDFTGSDYKDIIVDYGLQPIEKRNWFTYGIRRCIKLELHDTSLVPETYNAAMSINTNGGADEVLDLARCWLQTCNLTHPQCALPSEPLLPTRTISVGTCEKLPFLFSSKGSRGRYCALSYTWGAFNRNFATTFRKNLERQSQGWNMRDDEERDLPLMVRDAILITRHLGVDYLWIDAMCIVQDDPVEKASEVAKMKDIYQAAYCTLAATGSENAGHGLLRLRESLVYETRQCSFYRRSLYPSLPQKKVDVDAASINTRGWVFQESILSRRRLHWARNRIYWDCLTCSASEKNTVANKNNSIGSTPLLQTGFEPREETIFSAPLISKEATSKSFDSKYFYKIWDRWVSTYSSCHLTEATDRLIAIGGLANFMNGFLLDQYHAGLWRGNFLEGLQWYTTRPQGPDQDKKEVEGGRKPYLAPTWSWASITWPVNNIFDRNAERLGPGSWSKWESDRDNEWLYTLDIIDISTPPSGPDPCGAVTPDSKLTVSVKIRPLLQTGWIIDSQSDMHENFGFQFCDPEYTFEGLLGKDKDRRHLAKFDSRDIVPHPDEGLHCVEVCYDVDAAPKAYSAPGPGGNVISSPVHSHGLILEPVEKSDNGSLPKKWRRIGIAKLTDGSYFSRCEKTIIEIV